VQQMFGWIPRFLRASSARAVEQFVLHPCAGSLDAATSSLRPTRNSDRSSKHARANLFFPWAAASIGSCFAHNAAIVPIMRWS
jgi:hypothetical protein